ncbi:MAG: hypothetical protein MO852_16505, partial [Candidatus Devosia euplotis]|nr:hypothetical protein [Candidatus Devosia euplotis]
EMFPTAALLTGSNTDVVPVFTAMDGETPIRCYAQQPALLDVFPGPVGVNVMQFCGHMQEVAPPEMLTDVSSIWSRAACWQQGGPTTNHTHYDLTCGSVPAFLAGYADTVPIGVLDWEVERCTYFDLETAVYPWNVYIAANDALGDRIHLEGSFVMDYLLERGFRGHRSVQRMANVCGSPQKVESAFRDFTYAAAVANLQISTVYNESVSWSRWNTGRTQTTQEFSHLLEDLNGNEVLDALALALAASETGGGTCDTLLRQMPEIGGIEDLAKVRKLLMCSADSVERQLSRMYLPGFPASLAEDIRLGNASGTFPTYRGAYGETVAQLVAQAQNLVRQSDTVVQSIRNLGNEFDIGAARLQALGLESQQSDLDALVEQLNQSTTLTSQQINHLQGQIVNERKKQSIKSNITSCLSATFQAIPS